MAIKLPMFFTKSLFPPSYFTCPQPCIEILQGNLHVTVCALVAAAVVHMSDLPAKLNPIILPLMASVKREQVLYGVLSLFF